jgi:hypothetical protein
LQEIKLFSGGHDSHFQRLEESTAQKMAPKKVSFVLNIFLVAVFTSCIHASAKIEGFKGEEMVFSCEFQNNC